jgi:hypothetical protein
MIAIKSSFCFLSSLAQLALSKYGHPALPPSENLPALNRRMLEDFLLCTATHRLGVLGRTENVAEVQHIVLPERLQRRPTA